MNLNSHQNRTQKAILLDGSQAGDRTGESVYAALAEELQATGWQVDHILLREQKIGNCAGCFFCWVRTPGICIINDDNRTIAEAIAGSDLMVYLTPITFGGYSSTLKHMVDHQIQNISPFFAKVDGEIHHQKRYEKYPDFLAVGWLEEHDIQAETLFAQLVQRNAINFFSENAVSGVVLADQTNREIRPALRGWLQDLQNGETHRKDLISDYDSLTDMIRADKDSPAVEVHRALLLVGSPKTRKSTSNSLGSYLFEQLQSLGIQTETIYLHTVLRSPAKMKALLEAVQTADLVTLAFPLYVDSLPAPVVEALERIAQHRQNQPGSHRQLFAAIANSGFPEARHNMIALAICEKFAQQAGFEWAGSLALGGGQGLIHGTPLSELDGRGNALKMALDMAAKALAQGHAIPTLAQEYLAKPAIPGWLYRLVGGIGWRQQAKRYGAEKLLRNRPYEPDINSHLHSG
jgi:multimeric flavodoxin WrbA